MSLTGLWASVGYYEGTEINDIEWQNDYDYVDTFIEFTADGHFRIYITPDGSSAVISDGTVTGVGKSELELLSDMEYSISGGNIVDAEGNTTEYHMVSADRLAVPSEGGFGMYVRCKSFGDSDSGNGEQPDDPTGFTIPQSLSTGDAITLSNMSPLMFGYFKVTGLGEGQWGMTENSVISPSYSQATFQYSVTGKTTAHLSSQNYQSVTGRTYTIELYLTFDSATTGSYILNDSALGTTSSYSTKGTFEIK